MTQISAPVVEACKAVAGREGIPASRIVAFLDVETGGREVESYDGRTPTHLPEPVWFWKRLPTAKRAAAVSAGLAQEHGPVDYNTFGATSKDRCERFAAMVAVDETAAYESCSWGLPQIMGFHAETLGYASAKAMVAAWMEAGVQDQVEAMVRLWDHMGIRSAVVAGQWEVVAARWNGPEWRENDYAAKLARADATWHARLGTGETDFAGDPTMLQLGDEGAAVEALQRVLTRLRYNVRVDGHFGPATEAQVLGFQKASGLAVDGKVGPETRRALAAARPRPLGVRALATMSSVARTTVIGARARAGKVLAVGLGGLQVAHASGVGPSEVLDHIQTVTDTVSRAKSTYQGLVDVLPSADAVPHGLASVALATATSPTAVATVGGCVGLWAICHGILRARTADEVSGRTV